MKLDELLDLKDQTAKPLTYCLCGSTTRAAQAFQTESLRLTLVGYKVLGIGVNARDADLASACSLRCRPRQQWWRCSFNAGFPH